MREGRPTGRSVLRDSIAGQWRRLAVGAVLGAGHQAGEALVPVLIGVVIDRAVDGGDGRALLRWLALLAVVYVALSYSFRWGARAREDASLDAGHALRLHLVGRVLHPHGGAERGRLPGALTSVATEDTRRVGTVGSALVLGFSVLTGLLVGAVALLRISLTLGLLVLLGTPLLLWLGHLLSKPLERHSAAEQERAAHASGVAADLVAGLRVLKGIGAVPAAVARYRRGSRDALTATLRSTRAEAWQTGMTTGLTGVFIAAVALIGGRLGVQGDITLGELVSAVGLALFLLGPLGGLAWVNAELAQGRASAARVAAVLAAPTATHSAGDAAPDGAVPGVLRLRGVAGEGLRHIDLEAAPGELLGVAVTDPAHAIALMRCLGRDTDPTAGVAELDGTPLTRLDPAALRATVLVAAHDADLFSGTVAGNVAAGAPEGADLAPALAAAGADDMVRSLPAGLDTAVSERGRSLSGGQRQRVALARALAADPPILVLHDPTTAIDAVTEARIAAGLRHLRTARGDRTTVLITTSPALLAVSDRVVLVDGGRTVDTAPHHVLAGRHPAYRTAVLS
ncbi:ABC transporter transmembrane domain-containing protein [Streptomyces sp. SBT349]|uniref:ABC transporter transmembrane domain-containing protein n=1 Tax=Streptomyces sp. SBT349 TaxID=1580539 RepID=UPI00066C5BC3|nr:ABC transporter ATP-binding protein [Streptomyces sp. SBT349]